MSNNAFKNNLRKLSFLGFGSNNKSDDNNQNGDVRLDDECAKVFAMDVDNRAGFDFHEEPVSGQPKYNENDYIHHRESEYSHIHVPLKKGSKSMRRKSTERSTTSSQQNTPNNTSPTLTPSDSVTASPSLGPSLPSITPLDSILSPQNSETGAVTSPISTYREESDIANNSDEESECVVSDPCTYRTAREDDDFSPDEKKVVQFVNNENENFDKFDVDGLKAKKKKRHHNHQPKFRKYSLPEDTTGKKHHHHHNHHHHHHNDKDVENRSTARRISNQPEDEELPSADKDNLDSHRSDDTRALRRHKTSRPSITHIGKGFELHPSLKKLYDHSPHAIFVELSELHTTDVPNEREWKETARWIKYEEDVEEGLDKWGKPHVASLSFHSLLNLRKCLENGVIILDLEEKDLPGIAYRISEDLFRDDLICEDDKVKIMRALLLRHRHVNDHHDKGFRFTRKPSSYASLQSLYETEKRKFSFPETQLKNGEAEHRLLSPPEHHTIVDLKDDAYSVSNEDVRKTNNDHILKRIPAKAEGATILAGEVEFLEQPAIAFVRLAEGVVIPSLMEVTLPVRFIFVLLGPKLPNIDYHEVGRSISTLMSNQQFHNIAYKADSRKELLSAINEFLDDSIVLPPGDWERQALLPIEEIKAKSDAIKRRKANALKKEQEAQGITKPLIIAYDSGDGKKPPYPDPLQRTNRPFGGMINDLKRRYPHFKSDIFDGFNSQCCAAAIFMYFAAVSGAIAFGGLLGDKTKNQIGISETLLSSAIGGVIYALLSGQPLLIVGTTGGLLLFDESLFQFCEASGYEFLTIRVFIGIWLAIISLVVAFFEGSVFVKLFTRFTEDIFSALIVLLYIMESIVKITMYYYKHPILELENYCELHNFTSNFTTSTSDVLVGLVALNSTANVTRFDTNNTSGLVVKSPVLNELDMTNQPNTALFCTILTLGTFSLAYYLKMFRNSQFLGRSARRALGDFGVPIAIICMVFVAYMTPQIFTEKLYVPEGLSPSDPDLRGWFIPPTGLKNALPVWVMCASVVPAMLVYILLFMETHIAELIINKKERNLKKGAGYHLDIVLVCLINILCGLFGFPWLCCAAVRSIAHTSALTVMSRTHAPGEKPHIIEVKEQRLSGLFVSIFIGLSVLMAPLLRLVPMSVLLGIFLYMGVASIDGIQFFDRMKLLFMPVKHHPQTSYVRKVRTAKMHLYTFIQLMCLIILWVVKSTKASLGFPFFLVLMVPLRHQLQHVFSKRELIALDGDQPDVDEDEPDFYAEAPLPG